MRINRLPSTDPSLAIFSSFGWPLSSSVSCSVLTPLERKLLESITDNPDIRADGVSTGDWEREEHGTSLETSGIYFSGRCRSEPLTWACFSSCSMGVLLCWGLGGEAQGTPLPHVLKYLFKLGRLVGTFFMLSRYPHSVAAHTYFWNK